MMTLPPTGISFGAAQNPGFKTLYRIRRTSDNQYSKGGTDAHYRDSSWSPNKGKEWQRGPLINHLRQYNGDFQRVMPDNWVVERYVSMQVKVDEIPAKDLMADKFAAQLKQREQRQTELVQRRIEELKLELARLQQSLK